MTESLAIKVTVFDSRRPGINTSGDSAMRNIIKHCLGIMFIYGIFGLFVQGYSPEPSLNNEDANVPVLPRFRNLIFQNEPKDILVERGQEAIINCSVAASRNSASGRRTEKQSLNFEHVTWFKNGKLLKLGSKSRKSLLENGSLLISPVEHTKDAKSDAGFYQCRVNYRDLTILSKEVELTVAGLGRFIEEPESITMSAGQVHRFRCKVETAAPIPRITWYKDGVEVGDNEMHDSKLNWRSRSATSELLLLAASRRRMDVLPDGTMEINPTRVQDMGTYHCVVRNRAKTRRSGKATLTVLAETNVPNTPDFTIPPSDVTATVDQSVTLHCAASGYPTPKISWTKDGKGFDLGRESRFMLLGRGNLWIKSVQANDEGRYECIARNGVGEPQIARARLTVLVPPRFTEMPHTGYYANLGSEVYLQCIGVGFPEPTITWYKNGRILDETSYGLSIHKVVNSDSGLYQCFAENSAGTIMASTELIVVNKGSSISDDNAYLADDARSYTPLSQTAPSAPTNLRHTDITERSVKLMWGMPEIGGSEVTHYNIYLSDPKTETKWVLSATQTFITIDTLEPGQEIHVKVVAYNGELPGTSSNPIIVKIPQQENLPGTVKNLAAKASSSSEIKVSWKAPEDLRVKLAIKSYQLIMEYYWNSELLIEEVDLKETSYLFDGLRAYTEYQFTVAIIFNNGTKGPHTYKITARTLEGLPEDAPEGLVVVPQDSSSIKVSWYPVPTYRVNGPLLGYKIRYKRADSKHSFTLDVINGGTQKIIKNLLSNREYTVRVQAFNKVGSGPLSKKIAVRLPQKNRKENHLPGRVPSVEAEIYSHEIVIMWMPPDDGVYISQYIISWGVLTPYENEVVINSTKNLYTISGLEPLTSYIISIRAQNQAGPGEENLVLKRTKPQPEDDLYPPVQVLTKVINHESINVTWKDRTMISDNRYYVVRYKTDVPTSQPRTQFINTTQLFCALKKLNPNTQYEIAIRVIKDKSKSSWSMIAVASTLETKPTSSPTDITIIPRVEDYTSVEVTWQPPEKPNGKITGYFLFYSTSTPEDISEWVPNPVMGEKLSVIIYGLTVNTKYFFKIKARNSEGYGPYSNTVSYITKQGPIVEEVVEPVAISTHVLYIIIAGGVLFLIFIAVVTGVVLCRYKERRANSKSHTKHSGIYKGKSSAIANGRYSAANARSQNGFISSQGTWQHRRPNQYGVSPTNTESTRLYNGYKSPVDSRYASEITALQDDIIPSSYHPHVYHEELIRTPNKLQQMYLESSHPALQSGVTKPLSMDKQYQQSSKPFRPSYENEYSYTTVPQAPQDVASDSAYSSDYPSAPQIDEKSQIGRKYRYNSKSESDRSTPSSYHDSSEVHCKRHESDRREDEGIEYDRNSNLKNDEVPSNSMEDHIHNEKLQAQENYHC